MFREVKLERQLHYKNKGLLASNEVSLLKETACSWDAFQNGDQVEAKKKKKKKKRRMTLLCHCSSHEISKPLKV